MNKSNFSLLRSPDPLDTDCSGIDVSFPLLKADSIHRFEIRRPSAAPGKKDPEKKVITLPCAITKDAPGTKPNEVVRAGWPVKHYLTVDLRTPEATQNTIKGIAQVVQATGKKLTPRQVIDTDGAVLDGAVFDAKVKINPASEGYGESNGIGTFIKPS